ncbi:MAG: CoA-binding protein [Cumulibacter sp.]
MLDSDPTTVSVAEALLEPKSIAIVGASAREGSVSARPLELLLRHGYAGKVYPVNPRYEHIGAIPCFRDLRAIGKQVDVVLSMVPAAATIDVVRAARDVGAKVVVVFASGFAEVGAEGAALQDQLVAEAKLANVRVLGPNCQGAINPSAAVFATFTAAAQRDLASGSGVAYVGQSGAVGGSVLDMAAELGLSLDAWVATGNQADLDLVEVATALIAGEKIRTVLMYAEGISDVAGFERLCADARAADKSLVLLRSGRSAVGRRAAAAHTGAILSADDAVVHAARQHGVVVVDDVDELLAAPMMLTGRAIGGRNLAIITTSGGGGILLADHCDAHGLQVRELAERTQRSLEKFVPAFGSVSNPVDVTAQILNTPTALKDFAQVCAISAEDPDVDGVAIVLTMVTGQRGADLARAIVDAMANAESKPVWVAWLASRSQTAEGRDVLRAGGVPTFDSVGALARAVAQLSP